MREPYLAGILSFAYTGRRSVYNGRIVIGVIWLVLTGVSWIGSAGLLGWVVHLISGWCAYSYAKEQSDKVRKQFLHTILLFAGAR